jgi:hypothetical protein
MPLLLFMFSSFFRHANVPCFAFILKKEKKIISATKFPCLCFSVFPLLSLFLVSPRLCPSLCNSASPCSVFSLSFPHVRLSSRADPSPLPPARTSTVAGNNLARTIVVASIFQGLVGHGCFAYGNPSCLSLPENPLVTKDIPLPSMSYVHSRNSFIRFSANCLYSVSPCLCPMLTFQYFNFAFVPL